MPLVINNLRGGHTQMHIDFTDRSNIKKPEEWQPKANSPGLIKKLVTS